MGRFLWVFLGLPLTLGAQVAPLWQTTFWNPGPPDPTTEFVSSVLLNAAGVDPLGNTIVGADVLVSSVDAGTNCWVGTANLMAKFGPDGQQLWASLTGAMAPGDHFVFGSDGSILAKFPNFNAAADGWVTVAKYAPDGSLLWLSSPLAMDWQFLGCTNLWSTFGSFGPYVSSLALDRAGNALLGSLGWDAAMRSQGYSVEEFGPEGERLWRLALPWAMPAQPDQYPPQMMVSACPDGSWVVACGSADRGGFIAKVTAGGQLAWSVSQDNSAQALPVFTGLLVNPKGRLCAVGSGLADVFSADGTLQHTVSVGSEALGITSQADFLLGDGGGLYYKIDANNGHLAWTTQATLPGQRLGVVPAGTGWLVGSHQVGASSIELLRFDGRTGHVSWQQGLAAGAWPSQQDQPADSLLSAPDGSLRLVAQSTNYTIQVLGFSVAR